MKTNRLKLMAAALLGLSFAACEEGTKPPAMGDIEGQVVIEGEGIDGVSVTLSSGATTTTSGGGHYSFTEVAAGTYTITITGLPADASFDATTAEVTIAQADQTVTTNFNGSWIRTASLMGMVTVEGEGLPGITVSISGRQDAQMVTDDNGQYTFTGLRAGNYTVEISGFDATDVGFAATSSAVEVAVGESKVWSFDGTYVRESAISGQVSVEGNGLAGVTVSLQGMGEDDDQNTDMGGQFAFSNLRAGEYQLAISGYDTDEYGFSTTSATVRVEHGRTANVPFEGILLRTASIMGQVSVEGEGIADVTVSLSGEGENHTTMTDESGQYAFSDLPAGNFQVGISGYDTDDYSFETTSKNVALALGETATVPFEGILLRTSGISGRVSVEGHGLDSVMVTLSGDDLEEDMTTMTDASGQYAIAGLAEGDYTVAISGYDAEAYIFEMTSMDVTLGDDDTQIVNFMGMHARTASISGMVYVDEAGKNDAYDEGENALAAPGIALALVGPGILDRTLGATGADGSFSFGELRAGPYQLVVANAAAAGPDYAYGGPAEGYGFNIGVGDEETQNIPFDITHTTVNFMVNLKSGDKMGAALPGATVSFFSDMAGEQKIGDAETGNDGMASLRIARSMAANHTVYASVAAPAGDYHTSGMRQAVMWDAQMTTHAASNDADIVNLKADFSFSGATITTDFGGGKALGGWAISVSSDKSAAADTPDKLGADGSAKYSEVVMADSLPVTYTINVAADQANTLDGGEKYSAGDGLKYEHNGLSLPSTMDAGMFEVKYTTQTLKVYVHHERDQVMGYTGNILGGDLRNTGTVDVGIRHIERSSGRSRAFNPNTEWASSGGRFSNSNGVVTFRRVPASAQVIVQASLTADAGNVRLLRPDELAAYADRDANGIEGGAFGDNGGYHHTVELCPLKRTDPTGQRFGECASFAFVSTHLVHGQVWKEAYYPARSGDGWTHYDLLHVAGTTVTLAPVAGENLAGDGEGFRAASADNRRTPLDERKQFNWGQKAAGVYKVTVPSGWVANVGAPHNAVALGNSLNPLAGDVQLDVTPTTGFVYGRVTDGNGFAVDSVTVNVNGVTAMTDEFGRYYAEGFAAQTRRISNVWYRNKIFVETNHGGHDFTRQILDFAPNSPTLNDFSIAGSTKTATISGTVTAAGTGNPVAGARIWVDYGSGAVNPLNAHRTRGLLTDGDGNYSATVVAQPAGSTVAMSATKSDMSFTPAKIDVSAIEGSSISGISFTGFAKATISGRVSSNGRPMAGVMVTAAQVGGSAADTAVTGVTGTYSLFVPFGNYDVAASRDGYNFTPASQRVNVGPGESKSIGDFAGTAISSDAMLSALSLSAGTLSPTFAGDVFSYTASVDNNVTSTTVTATANDAGAGVDISPADADATTDGHQVDLDVGDNAITVTVTAANGDEAEYTVTVTRAGSADASLSALSLSGVTLDPAFASGTLAYTANVANEMASTTVEATANDAGASVSIAPADANMVEMGHQVDLAVGDNVITVTVTAEDGSTQDYTVTVTRPISTDATLSALSLSGITFSPGFASDVMTYTATAGYDDEETTVEATANNSGASVAIVPADADATTDGHQVALSVGANVITVRVTAADGTTEQDYTVTVTRDDAPSSDATLSALTLSGVTLDPEFASGVTSYTASVGNDVDETTVDARQSHSSAGVAISPVDADADAEGHQVGLAVGSNTITVTVTAESGASQEYTVTVTRGQSSDASLSSLSLSGVDAADLNFDPNTTSYAVTVEELDETTVAAMANHAMARVAIVPADADADAAGHQIALSMGANTITVLVTAEDGTRQDYTITVTNARSSDVSLSSVMVNSVAATVTADGYAATVGNDVEMATIAAAATHADATATISGTDADTTMDGHQVALNVGANEVTITVTAANGTSTMDHTLTVTRGPSSDASLASFMVGDASVTADETDGTYTHTAGTGDAQVTVSATAGHAEATAAITSPPDADGLADGHQVDLEVGEETEVTAMVTAEDGSTTASYTLTITRPAAPGLVISATDTIKVSEGDSIRYQISLATEPTAEVTVTITDADRSGDNLTDPSTGVYSLSTITRVFGPTNWDDTQSVTIRAHEDNADYADHDVTLTHTPTSTDTNYGTAVAVEVKIADDDVETPAIGIDSTTVGVAENASSSFGVSLGAVAGSDTTGTPVGGDVTVKIGVPENAGFSLSAGGSSAAAEDTLRLTFTDENFRTSQRITVNPVDDEIQKQTPGSETAVTLTATASGGGYDEHASSPFSATVAVTVLEDDTAGVTVSTTALQVMEGETGTYTIKLDSDPGGAVVINAAVPGGAAARVSPPTWTANSDNWEDGQTFTVTAPDNSTEQDPNPTVTITHSVSSAPDGNGYAQDTDVANVTVTVVDDETAQVLVSPTALSIAQGASKTFDVSLTKAPDAGETVTITVQAAAGLTGTTELTFNAGNWENAQTVTIGALSGTTPGALTVTNTLSSSTTDGSGEGYDGVTVPDVTVTVTAGS